VKRKEEGMPRYGSSDERRQSSDYHPDQGRWRGEQQETRGGQDESWRENRGEQFGQGREDWRQRFGRGDDWRGSEDDERRFGGGRSQFWDRGERDRGGHGGGFGGGGFGEYGSSGYGNFSQGGRESGGYGTQGGQQSNWGRSQEFGDRDFERGMGRWGSDGGRGTFEREDRGPFQRLGDKFREMTGMQMRGPKGYKRSDDRVSDEVCERIARSGVDAENVEVKVQAGEVTLTGTVRNRQEKWRLEELAEDVFGVQDVHNNLRVSREQQGSRTSQPENKPSVRH
jgi:hypothetical protein